MLRRLLSRWLPGRGLDDREPEIEVADVAQALAPYRDEAPAPLLRLADPLRD
jgi:hypothetical protein